jgi:GR25 family glycosyltransferase involved in LPS biosynthesis
MNIFENHYYINLSERTDRNENAIKELSKLNIVPNRIDAVKTKIGIVGCALSHLKCINMAKSNNYPYVCIFEDDIVISRSSLLIRKVKKLIDTDFDVLMLSGNNFKPFIEYDDYIKVSKCFTTGAYIIKSHYYDTWINNLKEGIQLLLQTQNRDYSLDMYNHQLQRKDKWYLITPICAYQRPDYSDIENRNVDYKNLMLEYDK